MTTKRLQIDYLLDSCRKSAPNYTSALSKLGNGSMGNGIVELWKDGQSNGFVKGTAITSIVFTIGIGTVALIKTKINEYRLKKAVQETIEEQRRCAPQLFNDAHLMTLKNEPKKKGGTQMPKYIVQMVDAYTREVLETEDEVFHDEQAAEDYARECGGSFAEGAEVLRLAGRDYTDPDDVEFVVEEIDD